MGAIAVPRRSPAAPQVSCKHFVLLTQVHRERVEVPAVTGEPRQTQHRETSPGAIRCARITGRHDAVSLPQSMFCSQYVSLCYRNAGLDLVRDASDDLTSPAAIARSGNAELRAVLRRAR